MADESGKAAHVSGQAADSPSNTYVAPGRYREAPPGFVALGHPATVSPVPGDSNTVHLSYQDEAGPRVADLTTGGSGALGSTINEHTGQARLGLVDQARAASPGFFPQLGANAPGGLPSQGAQHTAPSGVGQEFRQSPQRPAGAPAMAYNHEPGEIQRPSTWNVPDDAA